MCPVLPCLVLSYFVLQAKMVLEKLGSEPAFQAFRQSLGRSCLLSCILYFLLSRHVLSYALSCLVFIFISCPFSVEALLQNVEERKWLTLVLCLFVSYLAVDRSFVFSYLVLPLTFPCVVVLCCIFCVFSRLLVCCLVWSYRALCCLIVPCVVLSCLVLLSCLVSSCLVIFWYVSCCCRVLKCEYWRWFRGRIVSLEEG
jgi:hypothetical protein